MFRCCQYGYFCFPCRSACFSDTKQHVKEIGLVPGGDAVNQAITLSKFGVKAGLAACIGADDMGALLSGRLQRPVLTFLACGSKKRRKRRWHWS